MSFNEYIGISAQTILDNYPVDLEVFIPDLLPMMEGDVDESTVDDVKKLDISINNLAAEGTSTVKVTPSNTFKCHYLGLRTGMSMPNIYLGEQVRVLQFKNTSQFYWAPLGRDDSIRKVEHLKIHVANKKETVKNIDDDTTYFIEMDTREGQRKIHIHTSAGTDEEVTYDLLIDTDKSEVSLLDSLGNGFHLMSKEYWMKLFNSEEEHGSFIEIDKDNIHAHAVDTYKVTCKHYIRESEEDDTITTKVTTRESTTSIDTHTAANTLNADDTDVTNTTEQTITTETQTINSTDRLINSETEHYTIGTATLYTVPVFGISGGLLLGGFIGAGSAPPGSPGGMSAPSSNEISEDLTTKKKINGQGDIVTTGEVTGKGVSLSTHTHTGDGDASPPALTTSPTPGS